MIFISHHKMLTGGVGMAYKIQYSPEKAHCYPSVTNHVKFKVGKWVILLLALAAAAWMRVNGIPDFLIPGDPTVTKTAATTMMDELRAGVSVDDAVTTFCKEILHGAGL